MNEQSMATVREQNLYCHCSFVHRYKDIFECIQERSFCTIKYRKQQKEETIWVLHIVGRHAD